MSVKNIRIERGPESDALSEKLRCSYCGHTRTYRFEKRVCDECGGMNLRSV